MRDCIARTFEWLLRLLLPAPGRHRAPHVRAAEYGQDAPRRSVPSAPRLSVAPLNGEDIVTVRPYVAAHERRQRCRYALRVCAHHDVAVVK